MSFASRGPFTRGWAPDMDAANGPADALLRADNLTLDVAGVLSVRRDSVLLETLATADLHSLYTLVLNGTRLRFAAADYEVYVNGAALAAVSGAGDVAFGAHLGQVLFARGPSRYKYDGTTLRNWGLLPPSLPPTVTPGPPDGKTLAVGSQALAEFAAAEGTGPTYQANHNASSTTGAVVITTDASTGRGTLAHNFASVTDLTVYDGGTEGDAADLVTFYVYLADPSLISEIDLLIDVNDTTFQTDYYLASFAVQQVSSVGQPQTVDVPYPETPDPVSPPADSAVGVGPVTTAFNVGWQKLSVARSQFVRTGSSAGKDWTTAAALRLTVRGAVATPVAFDSVRIVGGRITGSYNWCYCYAYNTGKYVALSAPSPFSAPTTLASEGAFIQIPADSTRDSQANEIWVFRLGGNLPTPLRTVQQTTGVAPSSDDQIFSYNQFWEQAYVAHLPDDRTDNGPSNYTNDFEAMLLGPVGTIVGPGVYTNTFEATDGFLTTLHLTQYVATGAILTLNDITSDVDALIADIALEADNVRPPENIIDLEGPHFDRVWALTSDGQLWPSRQLNPDSFATGQVITIAAGEETPYWVKRGVGGLYIGTSRDIYRLEGDGTELPDGSINLTKRPLNVDHPPITDAVTQDGNLIVYMAVDGWRAFTGEATALMVGDTSLLYRGQTRHGVAPVNVAGGRFRATIAKGQFLAITPEGADTTASSVLYRRNPTAPAWYRHVYGGVALTDPRFRVLYTEPDGTLLAGDTLGRLWQLDTDNVLPIPVTIWTRADDGGEPFAEKEASNLHLLVDTGGSALTVACLLEEAVTAALTATVTSTGLALSLLNAQALGRFRRLQLQLTGEVTTFRLQGYGVSVVARPAGVLVWDSGPLDLQRQDLAWLRRAWVKVNAAADVTATFYLDSAQVQTTTLAPPGPNEDVVLPFDFGKGAIGRVARVILTSTRPMLPYWVEVQFRQSGRGSQKSTLRIPARIAA